MKQWLWLPLLAFPLCNLAACGDSESKTCDIRESSCQRDVFLRIARLEGFPDFSQRNEMFGLRVGIKQLLDRATVVATTRSSAFVTRTTSPWVAGLCPRCKSACSSDAYLTASGAQSRYACSHAYGYETPLNPIEGRASQAFHCSRLKSS